jgi:AraC family transcriptional regulator
MIGNEYINRAIDYIFNHINDDLSVDDIASYIGFSRFHFSRLFKKETGEGIFQFIKRLRMEQSAFRLKVETNKSITEIGGDYGYSSSNYSSAFKQHHEITPAQFRQSILQKSLANPIYHNTEVKLESYEECCKKIAIEHFDDMPVIYRRYKGSYLDLSQHWDEFQECYKDLTSEKTLFLERTYNDPSITNIDECLYDICMSAPEHCQLENTYTIKGGKFAVYHFSGHVKQIYTAYQSIFNVWMPKSKYQLDERYDFEIYRNIDCDSMIMKIDLCIPVR